MTSGAVAVTARSGSSIKQHNPDDDQSWGRADPAPSATARSRRFNGAKAADGLNRFPAAYSHTINDL
jgi:hypothetical protein